MTGEMGGGGGIKRGGSQKTGGGCILLRLHGTRNCFPKRVLVSYPAIYLCNEHSSLMQPRDITVSLVICILAGPPLLLLRRFADRFLPGSWLEQRWLELSEPRRRRESSCRVFVRFRKTRERKGERERRREGSKDTKKIEGIYGGRMRVWLMDFAPSSFSVFWQRLLASEGYGSSEGMEFRTSCALDR